MAFDALAAVGAVVQIAKTLYEYYNIYKHNQALLDILEGFSANLEVGIERLKAREELFQLGENGQNEALDSIERDFRNAKNWLLANDKNLRSKWTALEAADKLKDLDDRLTKAFAGKMCCAIFSSLQDTRHGVMKIQTTLEGLPANLETVCRTSTKEAIHEAISELKEEAYQAVGGKGGRERGFRNGEAEKIISQLVDQLAAQERLKEEEEEYLLGDYAPLEPTTIPYSATAGSSSQGPVPYTPVSAPPSRRASRSISSEVDDPFEPASTSSSRRSSSLRPTTGTSSIRSQRTLATSTLVPSDLESGTDPATDQKRQRKKDKLPPGSILFLPRDPFTNEDLVDPVLANDGLIHDRWTLVSTCCENVRDPSEPLLILGDVVQLREAIFQQYPQRRLEFQHKREKFREDTIALYDSSNYTDLPRLVDSLSHILLWEPSSISTRIRRAICRYRMRDLSHALEDLNYAINLSTRIASSEGQGRQAGSIDLDALRMRALVKEEMHENTSALEDLEQLLVLSPNDVLGLSLRAKLRAMYGDLDGAQDDLASTNLAVRNDLAYRSRLGDGELDIEYLARGWAYSSVHDFDSALNDFNFSLSLQDPPEPYTLACLSLATIKLAEIQHRLSPSLIDGAIDDLDASIDMWRRIAVSHEKSSNVGSQRESSGVERLKCEKEDGLPRAAYQCLLMRASARQAQGEPQLALLDFETSLRLRPDGVRDLASLTCALAEIRAECGDFDGAQKGFELAIATAESEYERVSFERTRGQIGTA
ncbi:hypothetical protein JCM16303_001625 [Sporobolomyces ruberrimus]